MRRPFLTWACNLLFAGISLALYKSLDPSATLRRAHRATAFWSRHSHRCIRLRQRGNATEPGARSAFTVPGIGGGGLILGDCAL